MITTHILDPSRGRPASGVTIVLERYLNPDGWTPLGQGETDADGRLRTLLHPDQNLVSGVYRLTFQTGAYFKSQGVNVFFPEVTVVFNIEDSSQHYHVPLLQNPFGYSTYRGS